MIIINAKNTIPLTDIDLVQCLDNTKIPVLDIYFSSDFRHHLDAQQRKRTSIYQQIRLPNSTIIHHTTSQRSQLTKRIRGFLQQHAQGVKINGGN